MLRNILVAQAGKLEKNTIPLSTIEGLLFCSKHLLNNSLQRNDNFKLRVQLSSQPLC